MDVDFIIIHMISHCFNIGVKLGLSFEMVNICLRGFENRVLRMSEVTRML
jgi:hypothetical protein